MQWGTRLLLRPRWHHYARFIATLVLADQMIGPLTNIPSSEAIVVVALGAIFAPVPVERRSGKRE